MNKYWKILYISCIALFCIIPVLSCKKETVADKEAKEMKRPDMQYAYKLLESDQKMKAADIFEKVLKRDPENARAHLELAIIYHQTNDFIRGLFHYREYAKIQPESEKINMVKEQYRKAKREFVYVENRKRAQRENPDEEDRENQQQTVQTKKIQQLENENIKLKKTIEEKNTKIESLDKIISAQAKLLRSRNATLPPASPKTKEKITRYKVKQGEHLHGIALKIYGDEDRWQDLYDVNKKRLNLKSPDNIQPGQVLIVPWKDNDK